jgi:hypothetical protein
VISTVQRDRSIISDAAGDGAPVIAGSRPRRHGVVVASSVLTASGSVSRTMICVTMPGQRF